MYELNKIRPRIDPCGTPEMISSTIQRKTFTLTACSYKVHLIELFAQVLSIY